MRKRELCGARSAGRLYTRAAMRKRILCIESDSNTRDRLRRVLEDGGFAVDETGSGLEGIARARSAIPDVILAASRLVDVGGAELAARLKRDVLLAAVPLVIMGRDRADRDVALAWGCDGFIAPPISDLRLIEELMTYAEGRRDHPSKEVAPLGRQQLEEIDRRCSVFMHDLAHELATPLTPLAGYLKILHSDKLGPLTAQQRKVVEGMASSVSKMTRIVENLASFASLQSGPASVMLASVAPDLVAAEVVEDVQNAARDARVHVEVRAPAVRPVMADGRKIRQALWNLVHNAVKYSPRGGDVLVEVGQEGDWVRFSVYDQGPGVLGRDLEFIFEPFRRQERTDEARRPGSGFGLPVARRIAEVHGGRLLVESPPRTQPEPSGQQGARGHNYTGSKFILEIPARPVVAATPPPLG